MDTDERETTAYLLALAEHHHFSLTSDQLLRSFHIMAFTKHGLVTISLLVRQSFAVICQKNVE
jgi:hypothetical protein